jgi:hypothetical protein
MQQVRGTSSWWWGAPLALNVQQVGMQVVGMPLLLCKGQGVVTHVGRCTHTLQQQGHHT